jgi:hemoglobin-like flavoprotein
MQIALTNEECALVQTSFAQVEPNADRVAALFYRRLFESDPTLARLFKVDMTLQGRKFMETLAITVKGLEDLNSILPFVQALGRRHVRYGVKMEDYDALREALLWALEQQLGPAFRRDLRAAWSAAFKTLASIMIEASAPNVTAQSFVGPEANRNG